MENGNGIAWQPDITKPEEIKIRLEEILEAYCNECGTDKTDIPPQQWQGVLLEMYDRFFSLFPKLMKEDNATHNEYSIDKIYIIYNIYHRLCVKYKRINNLYGFCSMVGIPQQTLYNYRDKAKLGSVRFDIIEKITQDNEASLENALQDKSINPMKILPILNRRHSWNLPGVTKENSKQGQLAGRDNLEQIAAADRPSLPE